MALAWSAPNADRTAYQGKLDLEWPGGELIAYHRHDWSQTHPGPGKLGWRAKANDSTLFESDSPPLTCLWVSDDDLFVIGLSDVKLDNAAQVILVRTTDHKTWSMAVACGARKRGAKTGIGCSESATNFVFWYDEENPGLRLKQAGDEPDTLFYNDKSGAPAKLALRPTQQPRPATTPAAAQPAPPRPSPSPAPQSQP